MLRMNNLKKLSAEMKYKHLLTQLEKQRDQNELDTSHNLIHQKNKFQHNKICNMTLKNEKLVKTNKDILIENNKKRVINTKIEKEVGIIKQVNFLKKKNKQKQDRLCGDFKTQENKLGSIKNTMSANLSVDKLIQKNLSAVKSKGNFQILYNFRTRT